MLRQMYYFCLLMNNIINFHLVLIHYSRVYYAYINLTHMVEFVGTVEFAGMMELAHIPARRVGGVRVGGGAGGIAMRWRGAATMFRDGESFFNCENSIILSSIVHSFFSIFSIFSDFRFYMPGYVRFIFCTNTLRVQSFLFN